MDFTTPEPLAIHRFIHALNHLFLRPVPLSVRVNNYGASIKTSTLLFGGDKDISEFYLISSTPRSCSFSLPSLPSLITCFSQESFSFVFGFADHGQCRYKHKQ